MKIHSTDGMSVAVSRGRSAAVRIAALAAGLFAAANLAAVYEARDMTHFAGERRPANKKTPKDLGLAFETVTFPGARSLPVEAWLIPGGGKGLVLLFHSYHDSKDSMLPTAAGLHGLGQDVVVVEFNGSGGSSGDDTSIGFHEAEAVANAVRWAAARFPGRGPVLYGVSMGAAAVLKAAGVDGVEARAIVIEAPFDRMRTAVVRRLERRGIPAIPFADLLLWWGGRLQGFDGFRHDPVEYARGVKVPALLLFGDQDENIRLAETEAILRSLGGPKALHVFRGVGHRHFAEDRPQEWREAVGGFLLN